MDRTGGDDPDDPHDHDRGDHDRGEHERAQHERVQPDGELGMFWRVPRGRSAAALVAGYRSARRQAEELAAALAVAGLADQVVAVTAGLDAAGEPVVCGVITLAGARRLAEFLAAGGPPPPGLQLRDGPPWAA